MNVKALREFAAGIGIDAIGWFTAADFPQYLESLRKREAYRKIRYRSYEAFEDAGKRREGFKTIIVMVVDYFYESQYGEEGYKLSNYSRFCWQTVEPRADALIRFIKEHGGCAVKVNTPDRAAACKAGLGFIGKNNLFYAYGLGSYVGIRTIGTDLELPEQAEAEERVENEVCRSCGKCIRSCPVNAIAASGYEINPLKCISFLNRHAEETGKERPGEIVQLDRWLFGCEVCQDVCPLNRGMEHKRSILFTDELDLCGLKVPNCSTVSREEIEAELEGIRCKDYKEYVARLIARRVPDEQSGKADETF